MKGGRKLTLLSLFIVFFFVLFLTFTYSTKVMAQSYPPTTPDIMSGDLDSNGVINIQDFILLSNYFNRTGPGLAADLNSDRVVNIQDFILLSNNFGKTAGK